MPWRARLVQCSLKRMHGSFPIESCPATNRDTGGSFHHEPAPCRPPIPSPPSPTPIPIPTMRAGARASAVPRRHAEPVGRQQSAGHRAGARASRRPRPAPPNPCARPVPGPAGALFGRFVRMNDSAEHARLKTLRALYRQPARAGPGRRLAAAHRRGRRGPLPDARAGICAGGLHGPAAGRARHMRSRHRGLYRGAARHGRRRAHRPRPPRRRACRRAC